MNTYLNTAWKFTYGNPENAEKEEYNDEEWYDVGLPHSFGIPYFMENDFYVGYGFYRRNLCIKDEWIGKRLKLEFMGVFQVAEIYINGVLAGGHRGGYTPFIVDITEYVRTGNNVIAVRVNNLWDAALPPRAGEHVFNGGIYRDVSLLVEEPVHIAWYGTSVTSEVCGETAIVHVETEIINEGENTEAWQLVSAIGEDSVMEEGVLLSGETRFIQQEFRVVNPKLWSPETPYLYMLKSRLNGIVKKTEFGIRTIHFTADQGFFLNGKHYEPLGANVHQDHAGWSDAVTRRGIQRDIAMIKECGMNFIRGSHYPHHPYFAEECDRQGLLFWSELCFWGTGGVNREGFWTASGYPVHEDDKRPFEENCRIAMKEMIRVHRNHPSIIVWSTGNEVFFSDGAVMEEARRFTRELVELAHELDPSRPVAVGGAQRGGFDVLGDIAGYNGDGASLYIDPGFPNFVSEYGSYISKRPGIYAPHYTDNTDQKYPWRSGKALWCGFHHGSIFEDMGYMGMIDYYRLPLKTWYWYRKELTGVEPDEESVDAEPVALQLVADRSQVQTDGTDDVHIRVQAVTADGSRTNRSIEVELCVEEGGMFFPTGQCMRLSESNDGFMDGQGAVEARAWYSGVSRIRASAEGLQDAVIEIEAVGGEPWTGQMKRWMQGVPNRQGVPEVEEEFNTALYRPVFCSSQREKHPAKCVASGIGFMDWMPQEDDTDPWVMVDLEGPRKLERIVVTATSEAAKYNVEISKDGQSYAEYGCMKEIIPDMPIRYVRVRMEGTEHGIIAVDCFA